MRRRIAHIVAVAFCLCGVLTAPAVAEKAPDQYNPPELEGVDIVEHLGDTLPLDLEFENEEGETVTLGQYFDGERPVIVTLGYYNCPMLCDLVLNGLVEGLKKIPYVPGEDFDIVTVSIDPREGPDLAKAKKANYLEQLGNPEAGAGWHFLTGERENIKKLAGTIGFGYRYDPDKMQYAHGAAIYLASPEGKLTRYLYGIQFPPKQLRLGLTEAGEGKTGTVVDRFLLRCYHFDPDSRKYGVYVWGVMRIGGGLTVLVIATMLIVLWRRDRRRGDAEAGDGSNARPGQDATNASRA